LIWVLTKLAIKIGMIMRIPAALEKLGIRGAVEKPGCNAQRTYAIAASPSLADFAAL
jgi:hypothetical protein